MSCIQCHSVAPKLNASGESFLARGYRPPGGVELGPAVPLSVWITGRHEYRSSGGPSETYIPKVELISGGPISDLPLSYFLEWRVVSLDLRDDGSLRDRSGRLEDAVLDWEINDRHSLAIGQFRPLTQYDVSLRLSVSEPAVFAAGLPGSPSANPRILSLRGFSPSGRSPALAYTLHSISGRRPGDGLFHSVTLPFPGEFSIPLSREARREASFEFESSPKGVFLETFYRRRLNSIGAHAFVDNDRYLATGVGRYNHEDFYATVAAGIDNAKGHRSRGRYSLELEYLPNWSDTIRPGVGFRVEQITHAGRDPAYIPYFLLSGPNTRHNFLLQVEGRFQGHEKVLFLDISTFF